MNLLNAAKKIKQGRHARTIYGADEIELAVAWAFDEVVFGQVERVLNKENSTCYVFLACALRQAVRDGMLKKAYK